MATTHNSCCEKCKVNINRHGYQSICEDPSCLCHKLPNPEDDGPNAAGNKCDHPERCNHRACHTSKASSWPVCPECQFEINPTHPYHQRDCSHYESDFDRFVKEHSADWSEVENNLRQSNLYAVLTDTAKEALIKFLRTHLDAAREEGYFDGQKHAFGVDRKTVFEEGRIAERREYGDAYEKGRKEGREEGLAASSSDSLKNPLTLSTTNMKNLADITTAKIYADEEVLKNAPRNKVRGELVFFNLGRYVTDDELEKEYESRELIPADLYALANWEEANQNDPREYFTTHWKDTTDKWCYAAFIRWRGVERGVNVRRGDDGWDARWWFAGVSKSSALKSKPLYSDSLTLELPDILTINNIQYKRM